MPTRSVKPLRESIKNLKIAEVKGSHISYLVGPNINNFFKSYKLWLQGEIEMINKSIVGTLLGSLSSMSAVRQTLIEAGIPQEVPAFTVNKVVGLVSK